MLGVALTQCGKALGGGGEVAQGLQAQPGVVERGRGVLAGRELGGELVVEDDRLAALLLVQQLGAVLEQLGGVVGRELVAAAFPPAGGDAQLFHLDHLASGRGGATGLTGAATERGDEQQEERRDETSCGASAREVHAGLDSD